MNKKDLSIPLMHHLIHKIPNNRPMVAEPTIRIYAEITAYQTSVLFLLRIVYAKSRQELGKSNTTNSRIKPLNSCLSLHFFLFFYPNY